MNTFSSKVFGVKHNGVFWAVEETNQFGNTDKYDFLLQDTIHYVQGYDYYHLEVIDGKTANIGDWELKGIEIACFSAHFEIMDKVGLKVCPSYKDDINAEYRNNRESVIRKCLANVSRFAEQYDSVAFYKICTELHIPSAIAKVDDLNRLANELSVFAKQFSTAYAEATDKDDNSKRDILRESLKKTFEKIKQVQITL